MARERDKDNNKDKNRDNDKAKAKGKGKETKKISGDPVLYENNFTPQNITVTLEENYMPYTMSVIISRAIPEIDGFKPAHRKLLYTMYKKGLLTGPRTKCANIVGETMKLNPHGDQAIYETLVRLARSNGALLHPFIDSKGNFGKQYSRDMQYAAYRYTEAKLEKICEELFKDLDKETVDFVDNYDGTMKEPTLFPVSFPNILVNPNQGVAVGMATRICSFNLREICSAACAYIDDKNVNLLNYIQAPDFPTGGTVVYSQKTMETIIESGKGSVRVRSKYRYDPKNSCIEVYEIPYTTTCEAIIETIIDLVKNNKLKEITDVRDETDLNGLKITIDVRKNTDIDTLMQKLYKMTPLEDRFACDFNVLINSRPIVLGVRGLLDEWLKFRIECVKKEINFDIKAKKARLHLLKGLGKILVDIDKAIKIIRETEKEELVIPNLMWGFGIDEIQANFIAEIKLRNLNKEYILNKISETDQLEKDLADLSDLLNKETRIRKRIKDQLKYIADKYGKDRLTDVIHEDNVTVLTQNELIDDFNLKVFMTADNYFKKIPLVSLRSSPEQKMKDGDCILQEAEWHNKSDIIFISNKQNVYKMKLYEMPDCKAGSIGEYLPNLLGMEAEERIMLFIVTDDYAGLVLFAFQNGKVAKIPLEAYATKTNRKKLINAYSAASDIVGMIYAADDIDIALSTTNERILVVNTVNIPLKTTKTTQGVMVLKCKKDNVVKYMKPAQDAGFADYKVYRTKNIPAAGSFLKDADKPVKQLSLL